MSLKPQAIGPVPEETARIARAAYPRSTIYLQVRDALGTISEDEPFAHLFPSAVNLRKLLGGWHWCVCCNF